MKKRNRPLSVEQTHENESWKVYAYDKYRISTDWPVNSNHWTKNYIHGKDISYTNLPLNWTLV